MFSDIITPSFVSTSPARQPHLILLCPLTRILNRVTKESSTKDRLLWWTFRVLFAVYFANVISWHFTLACVTFTAPELHIWLMSGPSPHTGEIDIRTHFYFSHFLNLPNISPLLSVVRNFAENRQMSARPASDVSWLLTADEGSQVPAADSPGPGGGLWQHFSKKLSLRVWGKCLDIGWKCQELIKTVFVSELSRGKSLWVLKRNRHFQSGHSRVSGQTLLRVTDSWNWLILWLY